MAFKVKKLIPLFTSLRLKDLASCFNSEMKKAFQGKTSCFPMIANPISFNKKIPKKGIALTLGGTKARVALFFYNQKRIKLKEKETFFLPTKLRKEELFKIILEKLKPRLKKLDNSLKIGLNFAYPLKPVLRKGLLDGRVIAITKEREIESLKNSCLGESLEKFLFKNGVKSKVSVANDSVCLLLAASATKSNCQIAGVVGTGLNFAFFDAKNKQAVNLESANFDKIPLSLLGQRVDSQSTNQGKALAEKEVSGAYLYKLFNQGVKELLPTKKRFFLKTTRELNNLLRSPKKNKKFNNLTSFYKKEVLALARNIFLRASQIVALQIAGILQFLKQTQGEVPVLMEGSSFWRTENFPQNTKKWLRMILPGLRVKFIRIKNSPLLGAAVLAPS